MCPCINRNARPNNNRLITYYQHVIYLLRIPTNPVNNTYYVKPLLTPIPLFAWRHLWMTHKMAISRTPSLKCVKPSSPISVTSFMNAPNVRYLVPAWRGTSSCPRRRLSSLGWLTTFCNIRQDPAKRNLSKNPLTTPQYKDDRCQQICF